MRTLDPSKAQTPSNNVQPSSGLMQGRKLSPAEERALQAEQRAASRQARCVLNISTSFKGCNFSAKYGWTKNTMESLSKVESCTLNISFQEIISVFI